MDDLFLKIYQVFEGKKSLFESAGLEPIRHIDMYRGQPLNPEQFEYYDLPALFVDWRIKWELSGKAYNGIASLDFHLVTDPTWETSNIATHHVEGLKKVLYLALVRTILDNLESESSSKLKRMDENPVDTGVVNYHLLQYTCTYYDPMLTGPEYVEGMIEKIRIAGELMKNI